MAERDGDDLAARRRRRERVRGERRRASASRPCGPLEARELVGDDERQRRALRPPARAGAPAARAARARRRRRARSGPSASTRARSRRRSATSARGERVLHGWKITTTRGSPAAQRAQQAAGLAGGEPVGDRAGQAHRRAVAHARRVDGDDAVGAQQVLGLVAQDEALERRGQEQHADRRRVHALATLRRAVTPGAASRPPPRC